MLAFFFFFHFELNYHNEIAALTFFFLINKIIQELIFNSLKLNQISTNVLFASIIHVAGMRRKS